MFIILTDTDGDKVAVRISSITSYQAYSSTEDDEAQSSVQFYDGSESQSWDVMDKFADISKAIRQCGNTEPKIGTSTPVTTSLL